MQIAQYRDSYSDYKWRWTTQAIPRAQSPRWKLAFPPASPCSDCNSFIKMSADPEQEVDVAYSLTPDLTGRLKASVRPQGPRVTTIDTAADVKLVMISSRKKGGQHWPRHLLSHLIELPQKEVQSFRREQHPLHEDLMHLRARRSRLCPP